MENGYSNQGFDAAVTASAKPRKAVATSLEGYSKARLLGNLLLRVAGLVLCAPALVLMITNKQTTTILTLEITARFSDSKPFVAMVAATGVCSLYLLMQTFRAMLALFKSNETLERKTYAWQTFIADQLLTYLLLGAAAASTEVANIAKNGSPKVGWSPVCQNFNTFCNHAGGAILLTHLGVLVMAISSAISAYHLFSEYGRRSMMY